MSRFDGVGDVHRGVPTPHIHVPTQPNGPLKASGYPNQVNYRRDTELTTIDILDWLQLWYVSHCDEDWEHCFGMSFQMSTPSVLSVSINFSETELDGFAREEHETIDDRVGTYSHRFENNIFSARGDICSLGVILNIFKNVAEEHGFMKDEGNTQTCSCSVVPLNLDVERKSSTDECDSIPQLTSQVCIEWLVQNIGKLRVSPLTHSNCLLRINTMDNPGWHINADIAPLPRDWDRIPSIALDYKTVASLEREGLILKGCILYAYEVADGEHWVNITVSKDHFNAYSGPFQLRSILSIFIHFCQEYNLLVNDA